MKKALAVILAALLVLSAVMTAAGSEEKAPAPEFSLDGGIYENDIKLEISGSGRIFYTTNGSVPTSSATPYTGPISLAGKYLSPRTVQGYVAQEPTPNGVTIRAAVVSDDGTVGEIATETYFVGKNITDFYGLPMVNLMVDSDDLWNSRTGIYQNYNYEHNVPAVFQYFTADGSSGPKREVEVKVSGHGSRSSAKKSLRIYFNKGDTSAGKYLDYDIIPGTRANYYNAAPVTRFAKVTMRISDWSGTNLRDVLAQRMGAYTRADVANSVPTALFLNGEYWGVYECREQYDERYVQYHYDIDNDDVVFFDRDWTLSPQYSTLPETGTEYTDKIEYTSGPEDGNKKGRLGESYYREQWLYTRSLVEERDITDPAVYAEFCANVDVDNYIDFLITYIYAANDDWPGNNFKMWRVTEENIEPGKYGADGKWRFMIHDFDIAFEDINHDTLFLSAIMNGDDGDARHPGFATAMLKNLLKNDDFRSEFAQRTMAYLSTAFSESNMDSMVSTLTEERSVGKVHDLLRWNLFGGPSDVRLKRWVSSMDSFKRFAKGRPEALQNQYRKILNENYSAGISGTANFRFLDPTGSFSINGAEIDPSRYGLMASAFSTVQFAGIPVRITATGPDSASAAVITVTHNGVSETYIGETIFTPESGGDYSVAVSAYADAAAAQAAAPTGIMRTARFLSMGVGEKLPAVLYGADGRRIYGEVTTGGVVRAENGIVEALAPGQGTITVNYNGLTFETDVIVKE